MGHISRVGWGICGAVSLLLGIIGIPVPILPTVPFLLLSAFCFSKASERLHKWLVNHQSLGPPIRDWQQYGAISRVAKMLAVGSMLAVFSLSVAMQAPMYALTAQGVILLCVATFILTRPSGSG